MRPTPLAIGFTLTLVVAACSGAGSTSAPSVAATSSPTGSAMAQRIEVKLTDALRMEPAQISAKAGQPVTFVVTNTGAIEPWRRGRPGGPRDGDDVVDGPDVDG